MKTLFIWLAGVLLTSTTQAQPTVGANAATTAKMPPTTQGIVGVWSFVKESGASASTDKKVKILLDKHWMFSQMDPVSHLTLFHHGGTYTLNGNNYGETIEYANGTTGGLIGQTFNYAITLKGDTLTLTGIGNPWSEVWLRFK